MPGRSTVVVQYSIRTVQYCRIFPACLVDLQYSRSTVRTSVRTVVRGARLAVRCDGDEVAKKPESAGTTRLGKDSQPERSTFHAVRTHR